MIRQQANNNCNKNQWEIGCAHSNPPNYLMHSYFVVMVVTECEAQWCLGYSFLSLLISLLLNTQRKQEEEYGTVSLLEVRNIDADFDYAILE